MHRTFKRTFWIKGFVIFLLVILAFTIISRAAASFTVAKVSVQAPSARRIQHTVTAEGHVEKNREIAVNTQPDILIKQVLVNVGDTVEKGDTLLKLDMDSLQEQIDLVQDEIRTLDLQNEALKDNADQAAKKRSMDIRRAQEDYDAAIEKNQNAVKKAKQQLKAARQTLKQQQDKLQKKQGADQTEEEKALLAEWKAAVSEKEDAYEMAVDTKESEIKAAKRALEDAKTAPDEDSSELINEITGKQLQKSLGKLEALKKEDGNISAPKKGVITGVDAAVGQKTSDAAAVTLTDNSAGFIFSAQISKEDAKYVSVGDTVDLEAVGKSVEDVKVTSVETDETGVNLTVTVLLPAGSLSLGDSAVMSAARDSQEYSCTVPLTAVYQDNNKNYVYLLDTEDTVLGQQNIVRKLEVKVLDKNESYAAVDSSSLSEDSQIVTDTDRYVEAGAKVRLEEE